MVGSASEAFVMPEFLPELSVHVLSPDRLVLSRGGELVSSFQGELFVRLAPLLDGRTTTEAIIDRLGAETHILDIQYALSLLFEEALLSSGTEMHVPGERLFLELPSASDAPRWLQPLLTRVAGSGSIPAVVVDDPLHAGLEAVNHQALGEGRAWLLVALVGSAVWLGPLFCPGSTACWACFARRLRETQPLAAFLEIQGARLVRPARSRSLSSLQSGTSVASITADGEEDLEGVLVSFESGGEPMRHAVVRFEDCTACGKPERRKPEPLVLRESPKISFGDGGHRILTAEETFQQLQRHISPISGIVDSVCEDGSAAARVFRAGFIFPPRLHELDSLKEGLRAGSIGKGMESAQARTSALCEALERYSGVARGSEPMRRASFQELGESAIHPNSCMQFSQRQYDNRDEQSRRKSDFNWVPRRFEENRELDWAPLWSLSDQRFRYLPAAYCYYGWDEPEEFDFCRPDSNGNAAGNTPEEAILQGFFEVVERDAVALWWYIQAPRPCVDLASFQRSYFTELEAHYRTLGRRLWVLDLTTDLEIPTFAAISLGKSEDSSGELLLGFGTHLDPMLGVARALTELNQFLASEQAGRVLFPATAALDDCTFLQPKAGTSPRVAGDFSAFWSDDLREDIRTCVGRARDRGMETLVLDQTRADIGLAVVKVVVPGLRHFWARFAPGRLYDIPAILGWRCRPLTEAQLNAAHLCI